VKSQAALLVRETICIYNPHLFESFHLIFDVYLYSLDDVFLPKDVDPTEMDEIDREVEYFKR